MDWLKTLAPTVATALGGPLAGLAVDAIGKAFGWEDATKEKVEALLTGPLSGEQIAAIKVSVQSTHLDRPQAAHLDCYFAPM